MRWSVVRAVSCAVMSLVPQRGAGQEVPRIRIDGVYFANIAAGGSPYYQYFRFYGDATGITARSTGEPADIATWFHRDHPNVQVGTYSLNGTRLEFFVGRNGVGSLYSGEVAGDSLTLVSGANRIIFRFIELAFAPPPSPETNQAPQIDPVVSKTDNFSYDMVGQLLGVTTLIEIVATDADGDSLSYSWTAQPGSIAGLGPSAAWQRPLLAGRPAPGVVTVTVSDGKGHAVTRELAYP